MARKPIALGANRQGKLDPMFRWEYIPHDPLIHKFRLYLAKDMPVAQISVNQNREGSFFGAFYVIDGAVTEDFFWTAVQLAPGLSPFARGELIVHRAEFEVALLPVCGAHFYIAGDVEHYAATEEARLIVSRSFA